MSNFLVSARKYRPQLFSAVVGQGHITTTLKNAIRNQQLAHAFLFCGPRGVGKTTCARILAKTINCDSRTTDGEACNVCQSCVSFNEGTSMNIHELDAASNNSVDDIRSLVDQVRFAPQAGKYKVYIIDEVHMLSSAAFNAFLKTLEEPPPYAIFILATTEKHKILPTILSRCQVFDFKRITNHDISDHLAGIASKEHFEADKASLEMIAQKSEGCLRDALSIMDKIVSFSDGRLVYEQTLEHLNVLDEDYYFRLLGYLQGQKLSDALLLFDEINGKGFEGDLVMNGFSEFIRNLLVSRDEKAARLLTVLEHFRERYVTTAARTEASWLVSALNILGEAEMQFKAARNRRLHTELTLIKLAYLSQALTFLPAQAEARKATGAKPVAFRALRPMVLAPENVKGREAKLSIETNVETIAPPANDPVRTKGLPDAARDLPVSDPKISGLSPNTSLTALSRIRQQVMNRQPAQAAVAAKTLTAENLSGEWLAFARQLRETKNPAEKSFTRARLIILNENNFEVITHNNLEQKFIESEKRNVTDHLQDSFGNRKLSFIIRITDQPEPLHPGDRQLTKREQFQQIAEQYPLVKELKDRLRLELDY